MISGAVVATATVDSEQPRGPIEDWITGRGPWHMACFGFAFLGFIFFIIYLVGITSFSSAMKTFDGSEMGAFYYIPPIFSVMMMIMQVVLSRNQSPGVMLVLVTPCFHAVNALLMLIIWFIGAVFQALVTKEICDSYAAGSKANTDCNAASNAAGLFSIAIILMLLDSVFLLIAGCGRASEVKKITLVVMQQPQQMMVMQPQQGQMGGQMMQPQQGQMQGQKQPVYAQQPAATQQPQALEEGGFSITSEESQTGLGGFYWGMADLNPFLPARPVCVNRN